MSDVGSDRAEAEVVQAPQQIAGDERELRSEARALLGIDP